MAAATVAVVTPNVLLGYSSGPSSSSSSRCSRVRVLNPALPIRMNTLTSRAPAISSSSKLAKKNAQSTRLNFVFAASVEDTASLDTKVEEGVKIDDNSEESSEDPDGGSKAAADPQETTKALEEQAEKSKAMLDEVVHSLKDVAKLQDSTKQAYTESAEKAIGVLRDTTEQLKDQAEKAKAVLFATAQETAVKGKENLTMLAENSPDPLLKDIAQTALNAHFPERSGKQGAKIHDFCLGIPYGSILLGGGLLWFLLTGSTAAIRFGVFLGGLVLAMSITSLKVWKRGDSSMSYILGQGAIATVLVIRELRRFQEVKKFFPHAVMALLSAAMLAFYAYVYVSGGNPPKKAKPAAAQSA